jgi:hypothetical protein
MALELFADMRGQILRAEDEIRGTVNKETRIYNWRVRPRDFLNAETVHYGSTRAIKIRLDET